jgi:hypothetical protein
MCVAERGEAPTLSGALRRSEIAAGTSFWSWSGCSISALGCCEEPAIRAYVVVELIAKDPPSILVASKIDLPVLDLIDVAATVRVSLHGNPYTTMRLT